MHKKPVDTKVPTVSRVCSDTLIELVYDPHKRETALAVSRFGGLWNLEQEVRIETGEILVPYSAKNNLIANDCVLLPSQPEHHGDKAELLAAIEEFLHRYVDFSPLFERIAAQYVLLSWVHDAFNELPYLRLKGEWGSGKTRGLIAIGALCYKPFFASGASSSASLFRTMDAFGGTLAFDEADFRFSDATAELVKIFNNGSVKGLPVLRTTQNRDKEFNPQAFKVFGPKIIAMRERFEDPALESRFITEEMGLRPLRADIPIQLPGALKAEALVLRNRLLHFRLCQFYDMKSNPAVVSPELAPRLNQTAISLLSIMDDAGLRSEIARFLSQQGDALVAASNVGREAQIVAALEAAFAENGASAVSLREVAERIEKVASSPQKAAITHKLVGSILRTRLGIATCKSHGRYVIPATEKKNLPALLEKYGIEPISSSSASV